MFGKLRRSSRNFARRKHYNHNEDEGGIMLAGQTLKDVCRGYRHCVLCRNKEAGKRFREHILITVMDPPSKEDFDCPDKKEWSEIWPVTPVVLRDNFKGVNQNAIPQLEQSELSKQRFEICKVCEHATENGFGCELHKGCCFGGWRSRPESQCYADPPKWDVKQ